MSIKQKDMDDCNPLILLNRLSFLLTCRFVCVYKIIIGKLYLQIVLNMLALNLKVIFFFSHYVKIFRKTVELKIKKAKNIENLVL